MASVLTLGMVLQARAWCSDSQQVSVTTFHYRVDAIAGPLCTDVDFLTAWDTIYSPLFYGLVNNNGSYLGATMQILSPGPLGLMRKRTAGAHVGTGGADALPSQTSGLIRWGTNQGGRAYQGRVYIPFPSEQGNNTIGYPIAGYLIGLDLIGNEYVNHTAWTLNAGTQTINPVLLHRKNKSGVTPAPSVISSWQSSNQWATQRKRGAFGRPNTSPF